MAQRPSPPPSPQARRQAHVLSLRQALSARDRAGVDGLLGQWVHRHGVDGLEPLLQELEQEDPEGLPQGEDMSLASGLGRRRWGRALGHDRVRKRSGELAIQQRADQQEQTHRQSGQTPKQAAAVKSP